MSSPKLSIILVNWNNLADSVECLESLKKCTYSNYEVTVVDNGSGGDDARILNQKFGDYIRLIESEQNLGFAKGCNIGIKDALDRGADYVVLLNNDTIVTTDFLDEIVNVVGVQEKVGIAGGKILCYEFPDTIWFAGGEIDYKTGKTPIRGSGEVDRGQYDQVADVDWICSCFMFISGDFLKEEGMLDERFFFGWEDADICVRAVKRGYRVIYVPEAKIWHKGWGRDKKRRLRGMPLYYATRGYFIFTDKHFSRLQLIRSWLYFIIKSPRFIWDYARITEQWKAPIYILWAISDYLRMKSMKRPRLL
jgi:GT2 family glycosyltransferase